jgi:hypothetical protein
MIWSFALECINAGADMKKIMRSIAEESRVNPDAIDNHLGKIITTRECDISSPESAKTALKDFLSWEQKLCEALAKKQ